MPAAKSRPKSTPAEPKTKSPTKRSRPGGSSGDAATVKAVGTEALASAFPFNAAKPTEFEDAARDPAAGQAAAPPHPSVTGCTLTETTASPKIGDGAPPEGVNPGNGSLDRVRVDSRGRVLPTDQGVPIADNQNSLKAGPRGPALLEDFILREKITHFASTRSRSTRR